VIQEEGFGPPFYFERVLTMTNNIVDFTQHVQLLRANAEQPIPVEDYQLPNSDILMDPSLKLDILLRHASNRFLDGDMEAYKIHRLLDLMQFLYNGFIPTYDLTTAMVVRRLPNESPPTDYSVYSWGIALDRMINKADNTPMPFRPSYQLEAQLIEIEEGSVTKAGSIYPEDWMEFTFPEDDIITARTARHFVRRMNELIKINGGKASFLEGGWYVVEIPYGPRMAYMVALVLENPITLIPVEDRKKPE